MKYVTYLKMSREMFKDPECAGHYLKNRLGRDKNEHLKKSFRLMNGVITIYTQNGDDFIKNMVTIVAKFNAYKIPRIIKRLLQR